MTYYVVLTTVSDTEQAQTLARDLVESRLAACVTIQSGLRSVYRWEGRVQDESEQLLLIKTREDRLDELEERILAVHPYDVPEFLALGVERGSSGYLGWVDGCLLED